MTGWMGRGWLGLVLLGIALAGPAAAASLAITVGARFCGVTDEKGNPGYSYDVSWISTPSTPVTYKINVGNRCLIKGQRCSVPGPECQLECKGSCKVTLACPYGPGPFVQVTSIADTSITSGRIIAPGPTPKCR